MDVIYRCWIYNRIPCQSRTVANFFFVPVPSASETSCWDILSVVILIRIRLHTRFLYNQEPGWWAPDTICSWFACFPVKGGSFVSYVVTPTRSICHVIVWENTKVRCDLLFMPRENAWSRKVKNDVPRGKKRRLHSALTLYLKVQ